MTEATLKTSITPTEYMVFPRRFTHFHMIMDFHCLPLLQKVLETCKGISLQLWYKQSIQLSHSMETNPSEQATGTTLSRNGCPVAFCSHTMIMNMSKSAVKKESYVTAESLTNGWHYFTGHYFSFTLTKSVHFLFNTNHTANSRMTKLQDGSRSMLSLRY